MGSATSSAQIERSTGKDGVVELSNRRQAERVKAERKRREEAVADTIGGALPGSSIHLDTGSSGALDEKSSRYAEHIQEASRLYHLPQALLRAVIQVESNFDPRAVSPANAQGLMQLLPATAERMSVVDLLDPRQNILGGARFLRVLANTFNGDLHLTLAAYNAGPGAVARHGGIPPYAETQNYVAKVLELYQSYSR
jgi:soluble lytic murein transglycosylase-like protein